MAQTVNPTREDTFSVTVTVGSWNTGVWDKKSGGELDSDDGIYYPGAMGPQIALGGRRKPGNITVSRLYRLQRDHDTIQRLLDAVGKQLVTVKQQPLDIDGNAYGAPIVMNCRLKKVTPPTHDSSSSNAAMIELELVQNSDPTLGG